METKAINQSRKKTCICLPNTGIFFFLFAFESICKISCRVKEEKRKDQKLVVPLVGSGYCIKLQAKRQITRV